jgi:hypothetical protein
MEERGREAGREVKKEREARKVGEKDRNAFGSFLSTVDWKKSCLCTEMYRLFFLLSLFPKPHSLTTIS